MTQWIVPPVGMIEPSPAPEFYVDDVGGIERTGTNIRVYYCAKQLPLEAHGAPPQHIVQVRIVRPISTIPAAIMRLLQCLDPDHRLDIPHHGPSKPRLVT